MYSDLKPSKARDGRGVWRCCDHIGLLLPGATDRVIRMVDRLAVLAQVEHFNGDADGRRIRWDRAPM
jgi:hypothetical protein